MKMKTVTVAFQLRVPTRMRREDIESFVEDAINSEPGHRDPNSLEHVVHLYKGRTEVFMP